MWKVNFGGPADRSLEAARPEAAADAAVAADQNLSSVSVVGEGVFALEGHRLEKKKTQKGPVNKGRRQDQRASEAFQHHYTVGLQGGLQQLKLPCPSGGNNETLYDVKCFNRRLNSLQLKLLGQHRPHLFGKAARFMDAKHQRQHPQLRLSRSRWTEQTQPPLKALIG